jgi:Flp pilus assembly protein TadD
MYGAAAAELRRAIQLKPDFSRLHQKLGEAYAKLGDTQAALGQHQQLEKLDAKAAKELLDFIHESCDGIKNES